MNTMMTRLFHALSLVLMVLSVGGAGTAYAQGSEVSPLDVKRLSEMLDELRRVPPNVWKARFAQDELAIQAVLKNVKQWEDDARGECDR